jgi:hypothetical protein
MRRNRQGSLPSPPTTDSPFDRWSTEDIYAALEAQLMGLQEAMDDYRRSPNPDDKAMKLAVAQIKMDTAVEALGALRKRIANVANGKRNG